MGPPRVGAAPPRRETTHRHPESQTGNDPAFTRILARATDSPRQAALDFETGWRLGWGHAFDVGYAAGVRDEGDAWQAIFTGFAETVRRPRYAELQAQRATLRRCRCDRCSACVRWAAIRRNRARYGRDNYPGRAA